MGCTDSHCGGAGIGEVNKPAQTFNFPNSYSLANNLREAQITITPPQSDLPRRSLQQKPVLTNPSNVSSMKGSVLEHWEPGASAIFFFIQAKLGFPVIKHLCALLMITQVKLTPLINH